MSKAEVQALLKDYGIQLDQQSVNEGKVVGTGAYGTVINVKVNGAPCVAKRIHDILVGVRGFEPVGIDQWLPVLKSFAKECKLLSKMRHPNVVQFIGVCELDPREPRTLALVMERLHTDLASYIEKTRSHIPLPSKLIILHGTSSGLLYLHSHKVVHRDLNARNVLLTESLQAKVADLGVARVMKTMSKARNLTRTPGCLEYMPPEALVQNPEYDAKLDCFSFGHLMLYLIIEQDPFPYDPTYDSQHPRTSMSVDYQIQKRQIWIDKMDQGHCLYNLVISCLRDLPKNRPEMHEINQRLESLCKAHPQEKWQSENIDQLLEQLTEIKETTSKLMSEPMEMNALHKHVSDLEEQHAREAEKIQQTKEQVQFSQELLKRRSENIQAMSFQMQALETRMLQHLDHLGGGNETARCTQLEEQVCRMQEENAVKDSELDGVKNELQHVREELQQVSEENRKNIDGLTVVLRKLADKDQLINQLQTQVRAESEALTQVDKLLRERSAELDNARKENSELQLIVHELLTEMDSQKRSAQLDEVHRMREENAAKDPELQSVKEVFQHVRKKLQQLSEESQKSVGDLTPVLSETEECASLQEEKNAENCELQINIHEHKSEADARKRSATLDEDKHRNSKTNQAQQNPNSATSPPVPLKKSATLPRRNVQRPCDQYVPGSSEATKHPALVPSSAEMPKPVRHTEPGLATGLNKTLTYDSKLSDILERRRLRSESDAQTHVHCPNTTPNQSGPTSSPAQQPIRSKPLSVNEDVGETGDAELKRKLQKWKVQAEGIDLSKEKDQAGLPQTNTQM